MLHLNATSGRRQDKVIKLALRALFVKNTKLTKSVLIRVNPGLKNQSKTLTLKNKNKIFPKFLSPSTKTTYGPQAPKNDRFFGSKLSTHLIIEAVFFLALPANA